MSITVDLEGLDGVENALLELKNTTALAVTRRVLKRATAPFVERAIALAPDDPATDGEEDLKENIIASTQLSKGVKAKNRFDRTKEVHYYAGIGTGAKPYVKARVGEYGSVKQTATPYLRPAWDATKDKALQIIVDDLAREVEKSAKSARKRGNLR